jgi:hypothetical protein
MASISKRVSGAWQNTSYGIRATATDTITTLPTTIYGDGTNATISIQGNTVQNGIPTPTAPVPVFGVGELDSGVYKIPILSAGQTTPIYLGEMQTTRKIKKLVLTGDEKWQLNNRIASVGGKYFNLPIATQERTEFGKMLCSHYPVANPYDRLTACCVAVNYSQGIDIRVNNPSTDGNIADFETYLQQQYAAGTPVTVWYVLTTEETAVVNEPLMKISDYADEVSGVSIPTTDGANTLSIDTTVQPSEVSVNYHGWHIGTVHERTAGQWD